MDALTVTEWIAIASLAGTVIFGFTKYYSAFADMRKTLKALNKSIDGLNGSLKDIQDKQSEFGKELATIKEQIKTLFNMIGGRK
ncbi:hypothetical protein [Enterococcus entomosocium]|uniref:hypothetical protein n=1 Tax=Enterococcus entomosocium TaxID=3034352 RepID=UPI003B5AFF6D